MTWSKDWIRSLDLEKKLKLYPLQFANCDRLEANDCVFIFDEVGTGKTVSSGLMAMHYLYNNPGKRVLVVTTHSVKEQFKNIWESLMPYKKLGYNHRVEYIGNHYVNLTNAGKTRYGLIIVDEAQLFLNAGTRKQAALKSLKADKMVLLTATPVKEGKDDLEEFVELAEAIVGKEPAAKVRSLLCGSEPWNEKRVKAVYKVNSFDEKHPVTRYFKDTIKTLRFQSTEKTEALRQQVKEWRYNYAEDCYPALCAEIDKTLEEHPDSRFIIFTRTKSESIKGSAGDLGAYFRNNGYQDFDGNGKAGKTYKILDGDAFQDKAAVAAFLEKEERPTVLLLTYQVGEQGLNLAGFDHVINLHISKFPANLEQRYGRIDRLEAEGHKTFKEIYMVFLLQKFGKSSGTENYYEALGTYISSLLPFFPSKNVLLNEKNITNVKEWFEKELKKQEQVKPETRQRRLNELAEQQGLLGGEITCFDKLLPADQAELKQILEKEEKEKNRKKEEILKGLEVFMQKLPDGVFYVDPMDVDEYNRPRVKLLGHPSDFGDEIRSLEGYKKYCDAFYLYLEQCSLEKVYQDKINRFFFDKFYANEFTKLFPADGYHRVFKEILEAEGFWEPGLEQEKKAMAEKYFLENCDSIVKRLPFFILLEKYRYFISQEMEAWQQQARKTFVPFIRAAARMLGEEEKECETHFELTLNEETGQIESSDWYKLAYFCTCNAQGHSLFWQIFHNDSGTLREKVKWGIALIRVPGKGSRTISCLQNVKAADVVTRGILQEIFNL